MMPTDSDVPRDLWEKFDADEDEFVYRCTICGELFRVAYYDFWKPQSRAEVQCNPCEKAVKAARERRRQRLAERFVETNKDESMVEA